MFCRKCGAQIPDDSEFCFKCGAPTAEKPAEGNSKLWDYNDAVNKMNTAKSFEDFDAAEKILETLGDYKDSRELLIKCRENKIHTIYDNAVKVMETAKSTEELDEAEKSFESLGDYENSRELAEKCREKKIPLIYDRAVDLMNTAQSGEDFQKAAEGFRSVSDYNNSDELLKKCEYNQKLWIYNDGYKKMNAAQSSYEFKEAAEIFNSIPGFEDSDELEKKCLDSANLIIYNDAVAKMDNAQTGEEFTAAGELFGSIKGYKNADDLAKKCEFNKKAVSYNEAIDQIKCTNTEAEFNTLAEKFRSLGDFMESEQMTEQCEMISKQCKILNDYHKAIAALECSSNVSTLVSAKKKLLSFGVFLDSPQLAEECEKKVQCLKNNVIFANKKHNTVSILDLKNSTFKDPVKAVLATVSNNIEKKSSDSSKLYSEYESTPINQDPQTQSNDPRIAVAQAHISQLYDKINAAIKRLDYGLAGENALNSLLADCMEIKMYDKNNFIANNCLVEIYYRRLTPEKFKENFDSTIECIQLALTSCNENQRQTKAEEYYIKLLNKIEQIINGLENEYNSIPTGGLIGFNPSKRFVKEHADRDIAVFMSLLELSRVPYLSESFLDKMTDTIIRRYGVGDLYQICVWGHTKAYSGGTFEMRYYAELERNYPEYVKHNRQ